MSKADDIFERCCVREFRDYTKDLEAQWEEHLSAMKHDAYRQAQEHLLEEARDRTDAYQRRVDELVEELRASSEHTVMLQDRISELTPKIRGVIPAYIAHRLGDGPDRADNVRAATRWVARLTERYCIEPVCPWIVLASVWPETKRDLGLSVDREAVERTGLMIACGEKPGLSPGMQAEASWATTVVDITGMTLWSTIDPALEAVGIRRRITGRRITDLATEAASYGGTTAEQSRQK